MIKFMCKEFDFHQTTLNWDKEKRVIYEPFWLPKYNSSKYKKLVGYRIKIEMVYEGHDEPVAYYGFHYDLVTYNSRTKTYSYEDAPLDRPYKFDCILNPTGSANNAKTLQFQHKNPNSIDYCFLGKDTYSFLLHNLFESNVAKIVVSGCKLDIGITKAINNSPPTAVGGQGYFTLKFEAFDDYSLLENSISVFPALFSMTNPVNESPNIAFAVPCPPLWKPPE